MNSPHRSLLCGQRPLAKRQSPQDKVVALDDASVARAINQIELIPARRDADETAGSSAVAQLLDAIVFGIKVDRDWRVAEPYRRVGSLPLLHPAKDGAMSKVAIGHADAHAVALAAYQCDQH